MARTLTKSDTIDQKSTGGRHVIVFSKNCITGEGAVLFYVMKPYAERFYKSQEWQRCREYVWQRDRGLCVDCIKRGRVTAAEEVHHVTEITPENITDPGITLNPDNLVSLCRECHRRRHGTEQEPKRYKVDELGRVVF